MPLTNSKRLEGLQQLRPFFRDALSQMPKDDIFRRLLSILRRSACGYLPKSKMPNGATSHWQ
jgi:hypothetical protein